MSLKLLLPQDLICHIFLYDDTYKNKFDTIILDFTKYQIWNLEINITPKVMAQTPQQFRYIEKLLLGSA
jgi:hypothetical protein